MKERWRNLRWKKQVAPETLQSASAWQTPSLEQVPEEGLYSATFEGTFPTGSKSTACLANQTDVVVILLFLILLPLNLEILQ